MRKVVTPQRDLFARSVDRISELPGLKLDERDYFRDIYDHLIRISDLIDSYRDLLSGATDLYLSTVSNRQNDVMKQLTMIATIFLPLGFITGFFGQNFGFLVTHLITAGVDILGDRGRQHAGHLRGAPGLLPAQGLGLDARPQAATSMMEMVWREATRPPGQPRTRCARYQADLRWRAPHSNSGEP